MPNQADSGYQGSGGTTKTWWSIGHDHAWRTEVERMPQAQEVVGSKAPQVLGYFPSSPRRYITTNDMKVSLEYLAGTNQALLAQKR